MTGSIERNAKPPEEEVHRQSQANVDETEHHATEEDKQPEQVPGNNISSNLFILKILLKDPLLSIGCDAHFRAAFSSNVGLSHDFPTSYQS